MKESTKKINVVVKVSVNLQEPEIVVDVSLMSFLFECNTGKMAFSVGGSYEGEFKDNNYNG